MSVLGIVGSPRKGGNTELYMNLALETCAAEGLATELIHLADHRVEPCNECLVCKATKDCPVQDDFLGIYQKMVKAQGIILSSPVFFSSATPEIKALIDRAGFLGIAQDRPFERKAGGAFVVGRRAGHNFVFMELLFFFLYHGMIIPGSTYWNVGMGRDVGDVLKDEEGIRTVKNFAKNLSWLIKKLQC